MPLCAKCSFQYPETALYCSSCGASREGPAQYSPRNSVVFAFVLLAFIAFWEIGASTPNENTSQPRQAAGAVPPASLSGDHLSAKPPLHAAKKSPRQIKSAIATDRAPRDASDTKRFSAASASTETEASKSAQANLVLQTVPSAALNVGEANHGVLGISGANWMEDGFRGVQITEVDPQSPAEVAGLHPHDIITDIDGRRIQTTQDLASVLSQRQAGSRISLGYVFKSNLGWMPKTVLVILASKAP
jgi:hypothetical protein